MVHKRHKKPLSAKPDLYFCNNAQLCQKQKGGAVSKCHTNIHNACPQVLQYSVFKVQTGMRRYLSGSQSIADGETIDGDLDLPLVDHVYNGLGSSVHWDDRHGEGSITIC